ncbi:MAG: putative porin, partial [Flavitalea sp.]
MLKRTIIFLLLLSAVLTVSTQSFGQGALNRMRGMGSGMGGGGGGDSLQKRVDDSITISFRYLDSSRLRKFDTIVPDFNKLFPVPWQYKGLGNLGNAAENMMFSPILKSGWDNGFHAYDAYLLKPEDLRFYNTTNSYSELGYILGTRLEQMIHLLLTRNIKPNWNASFQYRLTNSPGFFQNQGTNHNNYRFGSWYQSNNKRYQNFVVLIGNKLQSGENGGIRDNISLDDQSYRERLTIPTKLGGDNTSSSNFFAPSLNVATRYTTANFMMRQQYDFGQKDSIVTDTSVVPLFYPRLRVEHTISYNTYKYRFGDTRPDSAYYKDYYKMDDLSDTSKVFQQDYWRELVNDLSFYSFPDARNSQQFIKAGISIQ